MLLAQALTILAAGLVALVASVLALVAQAVGLVLKEIAQLMRAALPHLTAMAPWMTRGLVVSLSMWAVAFAWPTMYAAYSADTAPMVAAVIASMAVAAPLMLAVVKRNWAAFIWAVAVIVAAAIILREAGPLIRATVILAALAVLGGFGNGFDQRRGHPPD